MSSDTDQSELAPSDRETTPPKPVTLEDVLEAAKESSALAVLAKDASDRAAAAAKRSADLMIEMLTRVTKTEKAIDEHDTRIRHLEQLLNVR